MSASNLQLEAAIRAAPDDVRVWSIYGDWLEAEGDPRGAWVALMLTRESSPTARLAKAERTFYEANKSWLLPPELLKKEGELVWRRGFLSAATVDTTDGLRELLSHPAARFVEEVRLAPMSYELADEWAKLIKGAPWRVVHANNMRKLNALLALPLLREAHLNVPHKSREKLAWSKAGALEKLTLSHTASTVLEKLLGDLPPKLKELRLTGCRDALEVVARTPAVAKLALVCVDGEPSQEVLDALVTAKRPARLVLDMAFETEARLFRPLPGVSSFVRDEQLETAVVVLDSPQLGSEERATLVRLAQACRCKQLVALIGEARFGGRSFTVCRFHSDDNTAALLPVVLANELAKPKRVRAAAFRLSESNDVVKGLWFGEPASEPPQTKRARSRVEMSAAHKIDAAFFGRKPVMREVLNRMLGFDPGVDALEVVLRAIDEAVPVAIHGEPLAPGSALPPMLTEEPPNPAQNDEEDEEEEEEEDRWDDEPELSVDSVPEPIEEPVDVASRIDQPVVPLFLLEPVKVDDGDADDADDADEEEEDDEDAEPDAATADAGEIWNETPVEPEEDWAEEPLEDPLSDALPDPDQVNPDRVEQSVVTYCARCTTAADTLPCRSCSVELCETCLPIDETKSNALLICARCV